MLNAVVDRLENPPIVEVACGFIFAPVRRVDAMMIGSYWSERKKTAFPKNQVVPLITDAPGFVFPGVAAGARCWLLSENEEFLIQIQHDRFYFNWRKRGDSPYPHFRDTGGKPGVLAHGLAEFAEFSEFAKQALGFPLQVVRLELLKVDLLQQGKHWSDAVPLTRILPILQPFQKIAEAPSINTMVVGPRGGFGLVFSLSNTLAPDLTPSIQMETRVSSPPPATEYREIFTSMNLVANDVFAEAIPEAVALFERKKG